MPVSCRAWWERPGRALAPVVVWLPAAVLSLTVACTPLGVWVYDDPTFNLHSVTLRSAPDSAAGTDSMVMVFAGCNRNDYDVQGDVFELSLLAEGRQIGHGLQNQTYRLSTRDSSPVTVTLAMQQGWATGATALPVVLESEFLVTLPNGDRQFRVRQNGKLTVSEGRVVLEGVASRPCRPGISSLPSEFTRPVGIDRPEPVRPMPGSTRPEAQPGP